MFLTHSSEISKQSFSFNWKCIRSSQKWVLLTCPWIVTLFTGKGPKDKINSWQLLGWCYCFFATGFYRNLHCRNGLKNHCSRSLLLFSAALEYFWQSNCHPEFNWTKFTQIQRQERKAKRRNLHGFTILQTGNALCLLNCIKHYVVNK